MQSRNAKIIFGTLAAIALITIGGTAASAVQGRALPVGETLNGVSCNGDNGIGASIDPVTAVGTSLGGTPSTDPSSGCAIVDAYSPAEGVTYWVASVSPYDFLWKLDPATGISTSIGQLHDSNGNGARSSYGMISDPAGQLFYLGRVEGNNAVNLYTVNTGSAELSLVAPLTEAGSPWSRGSFYAAAYNPADGGSYIIKGANLFRLDLATADTTLLGANGTSSSTWWSMAFASDGTIWSTGSGKVDSATIAGWTSPGDMQTSVDSVTLGGAGWYSEANFVIWATPSAPANVTATASGSEVTVSWAAVAGASSYTANLGGGLACTVSAPATACVISNVPAGSYTASVTASNFAGSSPATTTNISVSEEDAASSSRLAATGANAAPFGIASGLLGLGLLSVLVSWRRRSRTTASE